MKEFTEKQYTEFMRHYGVYIKDAELFTKIIYHMNILIEISKHDNISVLLDKRRKDLENMLRNAHWNRILSIEQIPLVNRSFTQKYFLYFSKAFIAEDDYIMDEIEYLEYNKKRKIAIKEHKYITLPSYETIIVDL